MKKSIFFVLTVIMFALLISQTSLASNDTIVWKYHMFAAEDEPLGLAAQEFLCDEVYKRTDGGLKIERYPSAILGGERDVVQSVQDGAVEVMMITSAMLSTFVPEFKFLDLPFIFNDKEHFERFTASEEWQELKSKTEEYGIKVMDTQPLGFRIPTFRIEPVRSVEDFEGIKMRTMESEVQIDTMQALGATPVTIPYPEIYNSLRTKVVDGQMNDALAIQRLSIPEVAPHLTNLPLFISVQNVSISKIAFERLPAEYQEIVEQVFSEGFPKTCQVAYDDNIEVLKDLAINEFKTVTNIFDITPFREAAQPVYDKLIEKYPTTEEYIRVIDSLR